MKAPAKAAVTGLVTLGIIFGFAGGANASSPRQIIQETKPKPIQPTPAKHSRYIHGMCAGTTKDKKLINKLDANLTKALRRSRSSSYVRFALEDQHTSVVCSYRRSSKTYARSIIKVTLLSSALYLRGKLTTTRWQSSRIRIAASAAVSR